MYSSFRIVFPGRRVGELEDRRGRKERRSLFSCLLYLLWLGLVLIIFSLRDILRRSRTFWVGEPRRA